MRTRCSRLFLALVSLLGAPLALAATVTIVPSTLTPNVGDTFTVTITADVPNTFAATMGLSFNGATVAYVGGTALSPWNVFVKNSPDAANPTVFDVETPSATAANPGVYNVAELTFQAIAAGAADILINDDGGTFTGWFDANTAEYIPNTYTQANITITANGPVITVTDSEAPVDDLLVPFGDVNVGTTATVKTVTVANTGTQDLLLGGVALADPLALPYALVTDNCSAQTLAPAASCTLTIDFSPAALGAAQDTFDIPSNDPGRPTVTVSVSGTGVPVPVGNIVVTDSVAPIGDNQMPFGDVEINLPAPVTQTVSVTNIGNASLAIGQVGGTNPLAVPFSIGTDTCSDAVLAPSASCSFQVRFQPTALGAASDAVDIPSSDPDQPSVTVSVSGSGTPAAVADVAVTDSVAPADDLSVPFGDATVGGAPGGQQVTVTNAGTANLVIGTIAGTDPLAAPFGIITDTCSGQTIAPAANCVIGITFSPLAAGSANDSFNIPSNDPDEASVTVAVSGTGAIALVADITVTDSIAPGTDLQVPYGNVQVGSPASQTVTVTNDGTADLVIGTVAGSNPLAVPFSITANTCSGQTLTPATACTLTVAFAPVAAGAANDSFNIPSNDPDEAAITVAVSGNGTQATVADIAVSDSVSPSGDLRIDFGRVDLGSAFRQTFTVTNAGTAPLQIGTVAGANPLDPAFVKETDTCSGQSVAPASTCSIALTFTPDAAATYNDSFDVPSNDPDRPSVTLTVTGTGRALDGGSSAVDPAMLLALGIPLVAARRRARTQSRSS